MVCGSQVVEKPGKRRHTPTQTFRHFEPHNPHPHPLIPTAGDGGWPTPTGTLHQDRGASVQAPSPAGGAGRRGRPPLSRYVLLLSSCTCLPAGVAPSPHHYTRTLKASLAWCRNQAVVLVCLMSVCASGLGIFEGHMIRFVLPHHPSSTHVCVCMNEMQELTSPQRTDHSRSQRGKGRQLFSSSHPCHHDWPSPSIHPHSPPLKNRKQKPWATADTVGTATSPTMAPARTGAVGSRTGMPTAATCPGPTAMTRREG